MRAKRIATPNSGAKIHTRPWGRALATAHYYRTQLRSVGPLKSQRATPWSRETKRNWEHYGLRRCPGSLKRLVFTSGLIFTRGLTNHVSLCAASSASTSHMVSSLLCFVRTSAHRSHAACGRWKSSASHPCCLRLPISNGRRRRRHCSSVQWSSACDKPC
jgi:hypothetical protein